MSMTNEQQQAFALVVKDGRDRVAKIDGAPVATSSDETVFTASVADAAGADGIWVVTATGVAPGSARLVVQADADLTDGVNTVTGMADIEVTLDERTGLRMVTLTPGEVSDKPA